MRYKLMMCGFSAMCEDMQEVRDRLKVIPVERAQLESSPCYVIDLVSGEQYNIFPTPKGWVIEEKDSQDNKLR